MIKINTKHLLLTASLLLALAACDVIGLEFRTSIEPNGSGSFSITYVEILDTHEDGTQESIEGGCEVEDPSQFPLGVTTDERVMGDQYWCTMTAPFDDLSWFEGFLQLYGEEAVKVNCFGFDDDTLIVDLSLFDGLDPADMEASEMRGDEYFLWELTVPGPLHSSNAHTVEGNTLTWYWSVAGGDIQPGMPIQVNVPESGRCPFGVTALFLLVEADGTGSANLTLPLPRDQEALPSDQLIATLQQSGWQITNIVETGQPRLQARREFGSEGELNQVIATLPGLTGGKTYLTLEIVEDQATGLRQFTFNGRVEFDPYRAFYAGISPDTTPPDFRFDLSLPGVLQASPGMWSDPDLLVAEWDAETGPPHLTFQAESLWMPEPEAVDPETAQANLENIEVRFVSEIPTGQIITDPSWIQSGLLATGAKPGSVNNLTNGQLFACGDFQTRVLEWLEAIRLHPDPAVRAQLAGLDYGPIQAYRGYHQAVVIYPRGEDWRKAGHVLDPWPNQRPEVYTMDEWEVKFSWGVGPGEGAQEYSHLFGNPSAYPDPGSRVAGERRHPVRIGVHSPVNVLVSSGENRLGMLPDGSFVSEIPGAYFYPPSEADGDRQWLFGLPAGEYQVQLTGTDSGDYHILIGDEAGNVSTFGAQPIRKGEQATFELAADGVVASLQAPDGSAVPPVLITQENLPTLDLGEPQDQPADDETAALNRIRTLILLVGGVCVLGLGLAAAALVVFWMRKK